MAVTIKEVLDSDSCSFTSEDTEQAAPSMTAIQQQDRGREAYRVLLATTILSAMPWGVVLTFGVFNQYYQSIDLDNADSAVWIGVISVGVPFMCCPIMIWICTHLTPRLPLIYYIVSGWAICVVALAMAALCKSVLGLILTQGVLLGVGIVFLENPMLLVINSWFVDRRGMAYGIFYSSGELIGVGFSFLANHLLQSLSLKATFFILAAIVCIVSAPCLLFVRERGTSSFLQRAAAATTTTATGDETSSSCAAPPSGAAPRPYYAHPLFYIFLLATLLQAFSFYMPQNYLSTYATQVLVLPEYASPLLVALQNLSAILSQPLVGRLGDTGNLHVLVVGTSGLCAVSAVGLWGLAAVVVADGVKVGMLCVFAVSFGVGGSGFMGLFSRMGLCFSPAGRRMEVGGDGEKQEQPPSAEGAVCAMVATSTTAAAAGKDYAPQVFGWLSVCRGIACIVSGPLSEWILDAADNPVTGDYGVELGRVYGSGPGWQGLIVFTAVVMGATALVGGVGWWLDVGRRGGEGLGRSRKRD